MLLLARMIRCKRGEWGGAFGNGWRAYCDERCGAYGGVSLSEISVGIWYICITTATILTFPKNHCSLLYSTPRTMFGKPPFYLEIILRVNAESYHVILRNFPSFACEGILCGTRLYSIKLVELLLFRFVGGIVHHHSYRQYVIQ
jgi:hypothetical protein